MTKKSVLSLVVMPAASALIVSLAVGFISMYNSSIARAAEDKSRDGRIELLERNQANMTEKLDRIGEDVAFIRGKIGR